MSEELKVPAVNQQAMLMRGIWYRRVLEKIEEDADIGGKNLRTANVLLSCGHKQVHSLIEFNRAIKGKIRVPCLYCSRVWESKSKKRGITEYELGEFEALFILLDDMGEREQEEIKKKQAKKQEEEEEREKKEAQDVKLKANRIQLEIRKRVEDGMLEKKDKRNRRQEDPTEEDFMKLEQELSELNQEQYHED